MSSAAFFDVDGTLVDRHIVHQYIFIRRRLLPPVLRSLWTGAFYAIKGPYYKVVDKISRTRLNVVFYRNYAGMSCNQVRELVQPCFDHILRPHFFDQAVKCIDEHRALGRRIVLVTGSIDFIIEPLARFVQADALIAPGLVVSDGHFTGELDGPPVGQAEKARRVQAYAEQEQLDLTDSFAYGDSIADLPMLEQVGHPHVVNPDRALSDAARHRGWPEVRWSVNGVEGSTR